MGVAVESVVDQLKELTPGEREKVRFLLEAWPDEPQRVPTEADWEAEMERKGLLTRPKGPRPDPEHYRERARARVTGKPVSETIIEERR